MTELTQAATAFVEAWKRFSKAVHNSGDDELKLEWECVDWQSAIEVKHIAEAIVAGDYP
jgi:hypothetical protein